MKNFILIILAVVLFGCAKDNAIIRMTRVSDTEFECCSRGDCDNYEYDTPEQMRMAWERAFFTQCRDTRALETEFARSYGSSSVMMKDEPSSGWVKYTVK